MRFRAPRDVADTWAAHKLSKSQIGNLHATEGPRLVLHRLITCTIAWLLRSASRILLPHLQPVYTTASRSWQMLLSSLLDLLACRSISRAFLAASQSRGLMRNNVLFEELAHLDLRSNDFLLG